MDYPATGTTIRYLGTRFLPEISNLAVGELGQVIPWNEGVNWDEASEEAIFVQFPNSTNMLGPNRDIIWLMPGEWELARTVPTLHEAFR